MLSFRSILLAVAAFATVASAIPTPGTTGITNDVGGLTSGGLTSGSPAVVPAAPALPGAPSKRGQPSGGDIIKKCHDDIAVLVVKIRQYPIHLILVFNLNKFADAAVDVDGGAKNIKHDVVIALLKDIVAILKITLHDIKAMVKFDLILDGVACTLKDIADLVFDLLIVCISPFSSNFYWNVEAF